MDPVLLFYTTVPNKETAKTLAQTLLSEKLIACANFLPTHIAFYEWQDQIQEEQEHIMILKTKKSLAQKVEAKLKELHPYTCPCLLQIETSASNQEFLEWVNRQTKEV